MRKLLLCLILFALPLAGQMETRLERVEAARNAWPMEQITGMITMVNPESNRISVTTPQGIPYNFKLNNRTTITAGMQYLLPMDLEQDVNRTVAVKYMPDRLGDFATEIQVREY